MVQIEKSKKSTELQKEREKAENKVIRGIVIIRVRHGIECKKEASVYIKN